MADIVDYETVVCKHCRKRFGAITATHLRSRHGYLDENPVREYKERFSLPSASAPDVREKLKEHRIEFWDNRGQHWTYEKVLAEIRRRYQAGKSLRSKQVPNRLSKAAGRYFGSWGAAVQMASLDYDTITARRQWSREKVIATIQRLEADQVPLNAHWIGRRYGDLFRAAIKLFPSSWAKALRAAGFDPLDHKQRRGRWNKKKAVTWIKQRIDKDRSLLARDMPTDLLRFVYDALKTNWTAFVESFGVSYPGVKKRRDWTKENVLEEIRRRRSDGNAMHYKAVKRSHEALLQQAKKFYGSWDAARAAAGVEIDHGPVGNRPASD